DLLSPECDRLAILGLSYGAEAALLTAVRDTRLDVVIGLAPTDIAWEGAYDDDSDPRVSKWTWQGQDVPFVPLDRQWQPASEPPAFIDSYRWARQNADAEVVDRATIPVEDINGEVILVAGGDDKVWPSSEHAKAIAARRQKHGIDTTIVEDPAAGHPVLFPGEPPKETRRSYQVGGDDGAPQRLGRQAWPVLQAALHLFR
ncbi:MAG: acyl-CoA thioesterase, partial [Actinomycetota bacterium]|nr:acyl-CoA thioesterase [Actinomycetota bacterium]